MNLCRLNNLYTQDGPEGGQKGRSPRIPFLEAHQKNLYYIYIKQLAQLIKDVSYSTYEKIFEFLFSIERFK